MVDLNEEAEWRGLFARLQEELEPVPGSAVSPFEDASARGRVGLVITRAILGEQQYQLYRLYCGDPSPRV